MLDHDGDVTSLMEYFTIDKNFSVGYTGELYDYDDLEFQFHGATLNYLVHRWNNPESQANIYWQATVGAAYSDYRQYDEKTDFAATTGISADWENRRFFTSYENKAMNMGAFGKSIEHKARVGIAPYIGDYGDLHTWFMVQGDLKPSNKQDEVTITPLVRFFKGDYLLELGYSDNEEALANLMIRF